MMKQTWYRLLVCALMVLLLAGCKAPSGSGGKESPAPSATPESTPASTTQAPEGMTLKGIINRIDDYLILLTDDEVYQTMDLGEGVSLDGFTEGDRVEVTYTGELNSPDADPVAIAITKIS